MVDETRSGWRRARRGDTVPRPHVLGALAGQREETRRGGDGLDRHTRRRARRAAVAVSHRCEDRCGGQRVRDPRRYVRARAGRLPSRRMARVDGKLHDRGARSCRRGLRPRARRKIRSRASIPIASKTRALAALDLAQRSFTARAAIVTSYRGSWTSSSARLRSHVPRPNRNAVAERTFPYVSTSTFPSPNASSVSRRAE